MIARPRKRLSGPQSPLVLEASFEIGVRCYRRDKNFFIAEISLTRNMDGKTVIVQGNSSGEGSVTEAIRQASVQAGHEMMDATGSKRRFVQGYLPI